MNVMVMLIIMSKVSFGGGINAAYSSWAGIKGSGTGFGAFFEKSITPGCLPLGASIGTDGWLLNDTYTENENKTNIKTLTFFPNVAARINIPLLPEVSAGIGSSIMFPLSENCDMLDLGLGAKLSLKIKPIVPLFLKGELIYIKYLTTDKPFENVNKGGSRFQAGINIGLEI